ncbi:MAG: hypothetical protein NVSMB25_04760 [Thermoleophilaceae bacterium]
MRAGGKGQEEQQKEQQMPGSPACSSPAVAHPGTLRPTADGLHDALPRAIRESWVQMPWVETQSPSFSARHEAIDAHHAADLLNDLERFRAELGAHFEAVPGDIAVVIHARGLGLSMAAPWLPLARLASAGAGRRYMAGWFATRELHVLSPRALEERASAAEGSLEALLLSPLHEYAHLVLGANNRELPPPFTPRTFNRYLRWAWLCEGAATHLAGQTPYLHGAIARRLREGSRPSFPPGARDAPLLGGTVFTLLERRRGRAACVTLAMELDPVGPRRMLERAFGEPFADVERGWRDLLDESRERR